MLLIEEARCLHHLVRAYSSKNDFQRAYMSALEQLNAAAEANEDSAEVCCNKFWNTTLKFQVERWAYRGS